MKLRSGKKIIQCNIQNCDCKRCKFYSYCNHIMKKIFYNLNYLKNNHKILLIIDSKLF